MLNRLLVFLKSPVPGRVKTRLCPPLSADQAAALYAAFARDTLECAGAVEGAEVEPHYDPSPENPDLAWLGPGRPPRFFPQEGRDLGQRLEAAFRGAISRGAAKAVAIGSDSPHLEPDAIQGAFSLLDQADVVLGPARDGGYYLVGLKTGQPGLFQGIEWSTETVLSRTLDRAGALGLRVAALPELSDVDTGEDLKALEKSLRDRPRPPRATAAALRALLKRGVLVAP